MTLILPPTAVVRVSRGNFDPTIQQLPGLIGYYAAAAPSGSMVHVSLWESDEKAQQMTSLKEMIVNARNDAEAVGVSFTPIVNYPMKWNI
jgi:hypothetical protein